MARSLRWLFNGMTLLSLLLCVGQMIILVAINYREDPRFISALSPHRHISLFNRMLDTDIGGESFEFPAWSAIAFTAILPFAWLVYRVILWRVRNIAGAANVCAHCSYDLTGNASGTCPECGKVVEKVI